MKPRRHAAVNNARMPDSTRPGPATRLATMLVALGLGAAPAVADEIVHDYRISVDATLSTLEAEARFATPQRRVEARSRLAVDVLLEARDCDTGTRLAARGRRIERAGAGLSCLRYRVDLDRAARAERRNRGLAEGNRVVSPAAWLWRPELGAGAALRLRFELPDGVGVSLPWPTEGSDGTTYRLGRSPESASAPAVFGTFDERRVAVPGAVLRVTLLRADPPLDVDRTLAWLRAAASDVALAYGRFPSPEPRVVVIPVGSLRGDRSPVPFGRVVRDGGAAVELFVDQRRPLEDYLADWTATHEFSHLLLPYVGGRYRWISEGFSQYYQNVLLARSGAYAPQFAWQKIHDGLARGRASRPELSPNAAAAAGPREALMKVYWSGAALALLADVTIRERSDGRLSLDTALERLRGCCLPSPETWSGPELFRRLDSLLDQPVLVPLYERYADAPGFPDLAPLFARLGIEVADGVVTLRPDAELGRIRDAITARDPAATVRTDAAPRD